MLPSLALAVAVLSPARAQEISAAPGPEGIKLSARLVSGGVVRGRWNVALFDVRNERTQPVRVRFTVRELTDPPACDYEQTEVLPGASRRKIFLPFYAAAPFAGSVRLRTEFPDTDSPPIDVEPGPLPVLGGDAVVAWIGRATDSRVAGIENLVFVALPAADLPPHAEALEAFDAVHWCEPSATTASPEALAALRTWVERGGRLILETREPERAAGILPDVLAGLIAETVEATVIDSGSVPPPIEGGERLAAARLGLPGGNEELWCEQGPVAVGRDVGLGRVTVVGVGLARASRVCPLEVKRCLLRWAGWVAPPVPDEIPWPDPYYAQGVVERFDLDAFLLHVPERVRLRPKVHFLLLLLFAVLGIPVEYWVLRRLRRSSWTWVVYPLALVVITWFMFRSSQAGRLRPSVHNRVLVAQCGPDGSVQEVIDRSAFIALSRGELSVSLDAPGARLCWRRTSARWGIEFAEPPGVVTGVTPDGHASMAFGNSVYLDGRHRWEGRLVSLAARWEWGSVEVQVENHGSRATRRGAIFIGRNAMPVPPLAPGTFWQTRISPSNWFNPRELDARNDGNPGPGWVVGFGELDHWHPNPKGARYDWVAYGAPIESLPCLLKVTGMTVDENSSSHVFTVARVQR